MDIFKLNKKAWDKIGKRAVSPHIKLKKYKDMFSLFCSKMPREASVLDLGCGPGIPFTKELVKKGFLVTAVDISDKMIKIAKLNVPQVKYFRISMTEINFKDEFDGIFSGYSMLCLDPKNFRKVAKKAVKSLKKNGFFLLALNEPGPDGHEEEESYTEILDQKIYSRPYTEEEIKNIFGKLNMEIIKVARDRITSKKYGKEYILLVLMKKRYRN